MQEHHSIGDVLAELREEFPDVTVSKIRFLESQGLVAPERTPSGYRKFSSTDLNALRWILRQQRENFLPLKVIRQRLAEIDFTTELEAAADAEPHEPSPAETQQTLDYAAGPDDGPYTRSELAIRAGISDDHVVELEHFGLIAPAAKGSNLFANEALVACRAVGVFLHHGVETRHIRMFWQFAQREASLVDGAVAGVRQRKDGAKRVEPTVTAMRRAALELNSVLLSRALDDAGL